MIKENYLAFYTPSEEKANVATHAVGVVLSCVALGSLIQHALRTNSLVCLITSIVFGLSLITLYLASSLYHACKGKSSSELGPALSSKKKLFRIIDHSSIYILISGSYTPFLLILLPNSSGYIFCSILWICTIICIFLKLFFVNSFKIISTLTYLGMGWSAVFVMKMLYFSVSFETFFLIVLGGCFYTFGLVFYFMKKLPFHHAIWHMFVMAGSASHFFSVLLILKSFRV